MPEGRAELMLWAVIFPIAAVAAVQPDHMGLVRVAVTTMAVPVTTVQGAQVAPVTFGMVHGSSRQMAALEQSIRQPLGVRQVLVVAAVVIS